MANQSSDAEAYVDAAAALTGLPIDPAHHPGVIAISSASRRWRLWSWNFRCSMRPTGAGVPAKSRDLIRTDAATIATAVRAGATTAVAVTEAALARIEQRNPPSTAPPRLPSRAPSRRRAARRLAPSMFATLATAAAAAPVPSRAVARSRSDADRRGDHRRAVVGNRRVADRLGIGATRRDRGHEDGLSRLALLKILGGRRI